MRREFRACRFQFAALPSIAADAVEIKTYENFNKRNARWL